MTATATRSAPKTTTYAEPTVPAAPPAALLDEVLEKTTANLDSLASRYATAIQDGTLGRMKRALVTAQAIQALRKAITPEMMKSFMPLMNSPLGFKTDRPSKNNPHLYTETEVKEVLIAALLRGFFPFDNEFNIIAGGFFGAKNGYWRKLCEIPGISDIRNAPGTPMQHNGLTVVRYSLSWKMNGQPGQLIGSDGKPGMVFAIPVHGQQGPDATIGKASRRAFKMAYEQITGSRQTEDDEVSETTLETAQALTPSPTSTPPAEPKQTTTDKLAAKLGSNGTARRPRASIEQQEEIVRLCEARGMLVDELCEQEKVEVLAELTPERAQQLIDILAVESPVREPGEEG